MSLAAVELSSIAKSFGSVRVLRDIALSIADGEFLTLVGASGCGKSTLLRIIAGLEMQDSGTVSIGGASVDHLRPHERGVAMVFQSYALYPHMTVFNNIALPLMMGRLTLAERIPLVRLLSMRRRRVMRDITADVGAVARQLEIASLLNRRPAQLSGGQRQRVALGRAMVRHPHVFLMDEPLSNLDAKLRVHMRAELAELHARIGATFIYVTHDQVEAMTMSDRVAVMDAGEILQLGTPSELYKSPINLKVAQFIGSPVINTFAARIGAGGRVELAGRDLPIRTGLPEGSTVTLGVRPEAIVPTTLTVEAPALRARLRRMENLGAEHILYFDLLSSASGTATSRVTVDPARFAEAGEVALQFDIDACHVFGPDGMRLSPVEAPTALYERPENVTIVQSRGTA
ncbi:MAG TPA: ABC transporter ATP-binding protein [Casimicrobiaceae bacterium]|nr:ABC transporter ATP-binding protein [Casimicrobiaceae bacterium]